MEKSANKSKDGFIGLRVTSNLKEKLEVISEEEARSLSQICELLLMGGLEIYQKEGSRYMQRLARARAKSRE